MPTTKSSIWDFAENYVEEPEHIGRARQVALELGADPVSVGTGSLLCTLAALKDAKTAVEVGTGAGVSGLWLLEGMNPKGVLTTIDPEAEFQEVASQAFRDAQISSGRSRFITGRALEVLPRLAENSYDMFILDGPPQEASAYLDHATRLLRDSGVLVVVNALWFGQVSDPARRDPHTVMMRELLREIAEAEEFTLSVIPSGQGVALAARNRR